MGVRQNFIMTSTAINNMCLVADSLCFQGRGQYFCRNHGRGNASGFAHNEVPASSTVPAKEESVKCLLKEQTHSTIPLYRHKEAQATHGPFQIF